VFFLFEKMFKVQEILKLVQTTSYEPNC